MVDVGSRLLTHLHQQLNGTDPWSVRRERGFTWWSYRIAQHVEVGPPVRQDATDVCVLRIWTDVAEHVDPATNPELVVAAANLDQTMNALVWNPSAGTITECCTVAVHEDNVELLATILPLVAILQNLEAHNRAPTVAEGTAGRPALSNHPTQGQRPELDELLSVPAREVGPAGSEPSRFAGELVEGLGQFAANYGFMGMSDASGLTCEVPFTGNTPSVMQGSNAHAAETALVQVFTDQPHPVAGNGALVLLRLPVSPGQERALALANGLNAWEANGDVNAPLMLGAWCPDAMDDGNGLAFQTFLPNLIARPGLLEQQVLLQAHRARMAQWWLSQQN